MTKFYGDSHHEWAFVNDPTTSHNKSKMAEGGHSTFRKMPTSPYEASGAQVDKTGKM